MLQAVASFWRVTINTRVSRALGIVAGMKTIQFYLTQCFPNLLDYGNHSPLLFCLKSFNTPRIESYEGHVLGNDALYLMLSSLTSHLFT